MSLMTQSLKRLAQVNGGQGFAPSREVRLDETHTRNTSRITVQEETDEDPSVAECKEDPADAQNAVERDEDVRRSKPDTVPPAHEEEEGTTDAYKAASKESTPPGSPEVAIQRQSEWQADVSAAKTSRPSLSLPGHVVELRDAVIKHVGRSVARSGKVVVLVSVQAEADAAAGVATLASSLSDGGEVLIIDASASANTEADYDTKVRDGHGFTSLLDGTRKLQDVLTPHGDGLRRVHAGLNKGSAQAVDPSAIDALVQECRTRFPFTIISGGDWRAEHLPLVGRSADALYLVVRANVTEQATARTAIDHFDRLGLHVRGCILAGAA